MLRFPKKVVACVVISILAIMSLTVALTTLSGQAAYANNQRAITIHDGNKALTITTKAATIGEALERAEIDLDKSDLVEPARDTPLLSPAYTVNVYRARPVTIVDGTMRKQIMSPYQSARSIVSHAEMKLYDEDIVSKDRIDNFLLEGTPGLKVELDRATPLTLVLYGKQTTVRTQAKTVGDLLIDKEIKLGPNDDVSKSKDTPITEGMLLDIYRDGVKTETEEQAIEFGKRTIQDANRELGYKEVQEPGRNGKRTVTYQIELKNGQEVARKEIQSVVTEQPKEEVLIVGAKRSGSAIGGDLNASFEALRRCESGGNYANKNNPMYRGAYQFGYGTWANYGGFEDPADAPPEVQDEAALKLYQRRGWSPWPGCSAKLGL